MKIGIIGQGAIGSVLKEKLDNVVAVCDINTEYTIDDVIDKSDLVIECAGVKVVKQVLEKAFAKNKKVLIMSVGGLLECQDLIDKGELYVPSGAIAGIDGLKAAKEAGIDSVELKTTKPASVFGNYKEKTTIFEGTAAEAIKKFPKSINVAVTLSLAGIGPEKTKVKIVADPKTKSNSHKIKIKGKFGELKTKTENLPSPQNPKTSYLAVLSAIATVKQIISKKKIGT